VKNKNIKYFIIIKERSERITNKNFQQINKILLYKHLLYELKNETVFVDTDSNKILKEKDKDKKLSGINFYLRDEKFVKMENSKSFNLSPAYLMIKNFLDKYCDMNDIIVCSHVTSPFIKKQTINKAINYIKKGYESVSACTYNYEFGLVKKNNSFLKINYDGKKLKKTQNLDPIILLNGAFFIFRKKTFLKYKSRYSKKHFYYEINYPESIDINYKHELEMARNYAQKH